MLYLLKAMENNPLTHAGCIVFRPDKKKKRYLIITSKKRKHWVLPKGHIEAGRDTTPQDAALRELGEEAGLTGEIVHPLSLQIYMKKDERVVLQYFIVRLTGKTTPKERRTLRWVDGKEALEKLSFDDTKKAFQEALEIMRNLT
jgi:8-oxo-dGTP pyrophosphatase MutT (NUDIX family)